MKSLETIHFPIRLGSNVCLDFTNTAEFRGSERYQEFLTSYEAVLAWCWRSGFLSEEQTELLNKKATRQPSEAVAVLGDALQLREAIYRIFEAVMAGQQPDLKDVKYFNHILHTALSQRRLRTETGHMVWEWEGDDSLERPLWPVVLAAAELLTSEQVSQVRKCPNCGWLFLDTSRNHTRRWCSMDICGSEVKSRRQYERKRAVSNKSDM